MVIANPTCHHGKPYDPLNRCPDCIIYELRKEIDTHLETAARYLDRATLAEAKLQAAQERYHELLFAVETKHPGETRHETAYRYIRQAEAPDDNPPQQALQHHEEGQHDSGVDENE